MTILLTGGTGKTSKRIAQLLSEANIPYLLGSRNPSPEPSSVKFDWGDSSTYDNVFAAAKEPIKAIYLVVIPTIPDYETRVTAFIDLAVSKGVRRFVLLAGGSTGREGPLGTVWKKIEDGGLEWCVLRPTWFMENFTETFFVSHIKTIREEKAIYSACGDGKISFISATDIAGVAFHALTDKESHNTSWRIHGPERLTYDDVAATISKGIGREVKHIRLTKEEKIARDTKLAGLARPHAEFLAWLEVTASQGVDERRTDGVVDIEAVTGRKPKSFAQFVEENKEAWL